MSATKLFYKITLFLLLAPLAGCSSIFFYPTSKHTMLPSDIGLPFRSVNLVAEDGVRTHAWYLYALVADSSDRKGVIYYLHGNAENISTHLANVWWLPAQGYDVFMLDYRGFGHSEGHPDVRGALSDIQAGHVWLQKNVSPKTPLFILGQSLGGSLAIYHVATNNTSHFNAVVIDAAFTRYSDIVRNVASRSWLTWPIQYPLSWLIDRNHDPIDYIAHISPTPLLIIHSKQDQIIPYSFGNALFAKAKHPKQFVATQGPHIGTFSSETNRIAFLSFLNAATDSSLSNTSPRIEP